jgi:hypothetical protein
VVKEQLIKRYAIKAYGDWMYGSKFSWPPDKSELSGQLHVLEKSAPGTHWIGSWLDSRTSMDDMENYLTGTRTPTSRSSNL